MAYNFEEDQINEMYSLYAQSLEDIKQLVQEIVEDLSRKAQELKYFQVVNLTKEAIEYYNSSLKANEIQALNSWQEGDMSFNQILREQRAGDAAEARSRQLESQIEEQIQSMPPIDSSSVSGIDTTNWHCDPDDFDDITDLIKRFVDKTEDKRSEYASKVHAKKDENTIYVSIEPVILQTFAIVSEGFHNGVQASYSELERHFKEAERAALSRSESTTKNVQTQAQNTVNEGAMNLKNKVKSIWE